jgi:hypothetical protein
MNTLRLALALAFLTGTVFAQRSDFPAMQHLRDNETFRAAKITPAETKQIIGQVEATSFDSPDSWESELRARRVQLAGSDGLVVQGAKLLCGGTGNCQTWVFRRDGSGWANMFHDQAPIASGFGFEQQASRGVSNLVMVVNSSAETSRYSIFQFDGKFYVAGECYEVSVPTERVKEKTKKVPCK